MIGPDTWLWYTLDARGLRSVLGVHQEPAPEDQDVIQSVNLGGGRVFKELRQNQDNYGSLFNYALKVLVEGP